MILLPIQHRVNWRRPPVMCLLLIVINTLCFLMFSTDDTEVYDKAMMTYEQAGLLDREWALYTQYKPGLTEKKDSVSELSSDGHKAGVIILDRGFDRYLQAHWQASESTAETAQWKTARAEIQNLRNRMSTIRFGLIPAEMNLVSALTSIFMHGGIEHLLGNMIFLFLFGFAMEIVLGKWRFLLIYLASGLCAGGFFCLFNQGSIMPLVGASGAISGLMGMYVATYGLKRIRFFYSLVFWFGELTAPAWMVLPIWVGKELFEELNSESNVAYLAHAGGIISGYILTLAAIRFHAPVDETHYSAAETDTAQDAFNKRMSRANQQLARMDNANASKTLQGIINDYPDKYEPWEKLYNIVSHANDSHEYHELVLQIFKQSPQHTMPMSFLKKVLHDYKTRSKTHPAMAGLSCVLLAQRCLDENCMEDADFLLKRALDKGFKSQRIIAPVKRMLVYSERSGHRNNQAYYAKQLQLLESSR